MCINEKVGTINYGVCASRADQHKMDYALDIAPKTVQHLELITNYRLPIRKAHLVSIRSFYYGAMENLGCELSLGVIWVKLGEIHPFLTPFS